MQISIFGMGYVGLVTAACLAEDGHIVIGADNNHSKINNLNRGQLSIFEPGLKELLQLHLGKNLTLTDSNTAILKSEILIVCAGSDTLADGTVDTSAVFEIVDQIAKTMMNYKLIIIKSTLPVGSLQIIEKRIASLLEKRKFTLGFELVTNPEFLREGSAVFDCQNPNRIIIGSNSAATKPLIQRLYATYIARKIPLLIMDSLSAEMTKYAANSFLAAKISLMNEFSRLCEKTGADIDLVRQGLAHDNRIGPDFLFAGIGYGGSCFPKDIEALLNFGAKYGENLKILSAVNETNKLQIQNFIFKILSRIQNGKGKKITIWGVAFKPNTDDIRQAPAIEIIRQLLTAGAEISIYDPAATANMRQIFKDDSRLSICENQYEALTNADALVIATEWKQFQTPDFNQIKEKMKYPLIFDGRNMFSPNEMKQHGFDYNCIGRSSL